MEKYSKKMINDYILGNDIKDYSIEELEDDKEFMMLVIGTTNDEKFYNLCSERLKKDYSFVRYLIEKFKNNIDFICNVADYYLSDVENELSRIELNIIMSELTAQDKEKNMNYTVVRDTIYTSKRVEIEMAKLKLNDDYVSQDIGMGFLVIFDSFNSSEIVLNYFAKKTINEIFNEYDINLENMLHEQFKTLEQIDKIGINNYMLNFIGYYDPMLASYLSTHIDLMASLKQKIVSVQNNWDKYVSNDERKRYNLLLEKVHDYMVEIEEDTIFTETDMLYHIGKKLGIADKIAKYERISSDVYEMIMNDLDDEYFEDTFSVSPQDRFYYKTIMRIISSIAFVNNTYEQDIQPNDNKDCKILKIDFNKKKK